MEERTDFLVYPFTVDGPNTFLHDDGFSICKTTSGIVLKIHIANVAKFLLKENFSVRNMDYSLEKVKKQGILKKKLYHSHTLREGEKKYVLSLEYPLTFSNQSIKIYSELIMVCENRTYSNGVPKDFVKLINKNETPYIKCTNNSHMIVDSLMNQYNDICSLVMNKLRVKIYAKEHQYKNKYKGKFTTPLREVDSLKNQLLLQDKLNKEPGKTLIYKREEYNGKH